MELTLVIGGKGQGKTTWVQSHASEFDEVYDDRSHDRKLFNSLRSRRGERVRIAVTAPSLNDIPSDLQTLCKSSYEYFNDTGKELPKDIMLMDRTVARMIATSTGVEVYHHRNFKY